ncbi:MAG: TatD family hydrolase [Cyanobacteriota bacterium]|nr:TatD family hydrolase [Cyanobacteriota bacterium]
MIDSHVHLNFDSFADDLQAVAERWRQAGITQLIHACCRPQEFPQLQAVADRFPEVALAVGLHPLQASEWDPDTEESIRELAQQDARVVAIGETGLDFYKADPATIEQQRMAFRRQIAIAQQLDLALIIHCRDAAIVTREILQEIKGIRAVMHCWGGTPEETRWFVEMGFYISFSGIATFKNAKTVQQSVLEVPSDRLLIETDCPFLAPVPHRGQRNEPAYVAQVAQMISTLRQQPLEEIIATTTQNAQRLFALTQ